MIKIAHLYPYELDLYGENGNLKALKFELDKRKVDCEIINILPDTEWNLTDYDMIYIGSGRNSELKRVQERLLPLKEKLLSYISRGGVFLATGNSVKVLEFLELYPVKYYDKRKVSDVVGTTSLCNGVVYGFQNTEYLIDSTDSVIFQLEKGIGNQGLFLEGYMKNHFYATTLIGPILARNDNLCEYFVELLLNSENDK